MRDPRAFLARVGVGPDQLDKLSDDDMEVVASEVMDRVREKLKDEKDLGHRYYLFAHDCDYPAGGLDDVATTSDNLELLQAVKVLFFEEDAQQIWDRVDPTAELVAAPSRPPPFGLVERLLKVD